MNSRETRTKIVKTLAIIITTAAGLALPGTARLQAQDSPDAAALAQAQQAVQAARSLTERAQADTERALGKAQAQVEDSLTQQLAGAAPMPPHTPMPAAGAFSTRLQNIINRASGGGGPIKPLVIQSSNPDPKEQASLEEDLAVMAHILDKALEDVPGTQWHGGGGPQAMGINVLLGQGSGPVRNLYLDGYGALFFVSVNFPLVAPVAKSDEEKPAGDSAWEEAKQELYGGGPGTRAPFPPTEEFSQDKVNKLKTTLLDALNNASNIRGVKPEESITVCVLGGPGSAGPRPKHVARAGAGGGGGGFGGGYGGGLGFAYSGAPLKGTLMTIRVKKSDVDSFAKGKLSPEEFQKRARITTYATSADAGNPELGWVGGVGGGDGGGGSAWAGGSGNIWSGGSSGSAGGGWVR
jgi:hypothetical protein